MIETFDKFMKIEGRGKPYHFGLGFIKCRIDDKMSANFYHPVLEKTAAPEEWHDHRYNFESRIIGGEFTNIVGEAEWVPAEESTHVAWEATCKESETMQPIGYAKIGMTASHTMNAGSRYVMMMDTFHKVTAGRDGAITLLERRSIIKQVARVLKLKDEGPPVCPYSPKKTEEELYELIREVYANVT